MVTSRGFPTELGHIGIGGMFPSSAGKPQKVAIAPRRSENEVVRSGTRVHLFNKENLFQVPTYIFETID